MNVPPPVRRVWAALLAHRTLLLLLFLGIALPLRAFWEIAEDVYRRGGFAADRVVLRWLHARGAPALDAVMLALSRAGGPLVLPIVGVAAAALLWRRGERARAAFLALAVLGAGLLNLAIKAVVARPRPDLWASIAPETSFSFPSGHAMSSAALAGALIVIAWRTRARWIVALLAALFALGVGVSRMYLGVHYPSDVLAGWAASAAWVAGLHLIFRRGGELRGLYRAAASRRRRER